MKICSNAECKELNPQSFSQFDKCGNSKDGFQYRCRKCRKIHFDEKRENIVKYKALYYIKNKEAIRINHSLYYEKNKREITSGRHQNKEKISAINSKYKKRNSGKVNARNRKRQIEKIKRSPNWLSKDHLEQIKRLYIEAARLTKEWGMPHHVDHIVPLQGENVSGLHVPWNLQVLVGYGPNGNCSKGNKF